MIEWLRSLNLAWEPLRLAVGVAAARLLQAAADRSLAAMREWWPLTASGDALETHARQLGLERRAGESDDDWRRRVALAPAEARKWGQRRWLDDALPAGWSLAWELPRDGLRLGYDRLGYDRLGGVPYLRLRAPVGTSDEDVEAARQAILRRLAPDIGVGVETTGVAPPPEPTGDFLLAAPGEYLLVAPGERLRVEGEEVDHG